MKETILTVTTTLLFAALSLVILHFTVGFLLGLILLAA